MSALLMAIVLVAEQELPPVVGPMWERMATFGALGIITAFLLIERFYVGQKDRDARKAHTDAMQSLAMANANLATKIEDMNRAMWNFMLYGVARVKPPPAAEATPPKSPKVPSEGSRA